jgi:hypothetical protein
MRKLALSLCMVSLLTGPAWAAQTRYAIVEIATGTVVNVAVIEPGDGSTDAPGFTHIQSDTAGIGWHWDGMAFTPPPPRNDGP